MRATMVMRVVIVGGGCRLLEIEPRVRGYRRRLRVRVIRVRACDCPVPEKGERSREYREKVQSAHDRDSTPVFIESRAGRKSATIYREWTI